MRKFCLAILFISSLNGFSQLTINQELTMNYLVNNVLLSENSGLIIENIEYIGDDRSIALFDTYLKYNNLAKKGVVLSTGCVVDVMGPNHIDTTSTMTFGQNDFDLDAMVEADTYDASSLEFDFISATDSISFSFFFGSEEYSKFISKNIKDVFGLHLSNFPRGIRKNLAILPNNTPISIDNINPAKNKEYFIQNGIWNEKNIGKWKDNLQLGELAYTYQFAGFSTMLKVGSKVIPNERYHLKIAIADVADRYYDSAIFLEAGSFKSVGNYSGPIQLEDIIASTFKTETTIYDNTVSVNLNIEFEFDSDQLTGSNTYEWLDKVDHLLKSNRFLHLEIRGHTDSIGTMDYNLNLSENRAKTVWQYLLDLGIEPQRMIHKGFGVSLPLGSESQNVNRRVEFVFKHEIN